MITNDEIIAMALRSGASVGKWGDAVLSADSLQLFAKEIERQAYERAADKVFEMAQQSEYALNWVPLHKAQEAIRALIEGDEE